MARVAIPVFAGIFAITLGLGASWARTDGRPSVRVLGSGDHLSLLITAPHARMLIASGTDATAFGNALTRARRPASRRLDVLVLAGTAADLPVAQHAISDLDARSSWVMEGPLADRLPELDLPPDAVIRRPIRVRLDSDFTVTLTPSPVTDGGWTAEIRYGSTTVIAGSGEQLAGMTPAHAGVVINADGKSLDDFANAPSTVFVSPQRKVLDHLPQAADALEHRLYGAIVDPGSTLTVRLDRDRLRLPASLRVFEPAATPD